MHYRMPAVLTDWGLFPDQVEGDPARLHGEDMRLVQSLRDHLPHAPETYIMAYLAVAMGRADRHDTRSSELQGIHEGVLIRRIA